MLPKADPYCLICAVPANFPRRGQWIRQISKSPVDLPLRLDDASASPTTPQGQTSVSIDLGFRRGAGAGRRINCGNGSTLGEVTLDVLGTFTGEAIRFSSCLSCSKSLPVRAFGIPP